MSGDTSPASYLLHLADGRCYPGQASSLEARLEAHGQEPEPEPEAEP